MYDIDDKDLAIAALTIIAMVTLLKTGDAGLSIIGNIVCGLVGFVTGRKA